jgi:uncharacterized protein YecE (DUF72 family)
VTIHVGTSGWSDGHWEDVLYPPGTPPAQRLAGYVERFRTVELNASSSPVGSDAYLPDFRCR